MMTLACFRSLWPMISRTPAKCRGWSDIPGVRYYRLPYKLFVVVAKGTIVCGDHPLALAATPKQDFSTNGFVVGK